MSSFYCFSAICKAGFTFYTAAQACHTGLNRVTPQKIYNQETRTYEVRPIGLSDFRHSALFWGPISALSLFSTLSDLHEIISLIEPQGHLEATGTHWASLNRITSIFEYFFPSVAESSIVPTPAPPPPSSLLSGWFSTPPKIEEPQKVLGYVDSFWNAFEGLSNTLFDINRASKNAYLSEALNGGPTSLAWWAMYRLYDFAHIGTEFCPPGLALSAFSLSGYAFSSALNMTNLHKTFQYLLEHKMTPCMSLTALLASVQLCIAIAFLIPPLRRAVF